MGCVVGEEQGEGVDEVEDERFAQRDGSRLLEGQAGREKFFNDSVESLLCCRDKY